MKKKRLIMMLAAVAAASVAMAQGNGQAGITEATQLVSGYFDPGTKLAYAVGAVIGLVGGIKRSSVRVTPTPRKRQVRGSEPASS